MKKNVCILILSFVYVLIFSQPLPFIINGKYGYINCDKNDVIVSPRFLNAGEFSEGFAVVQEFPSGGFGGQVRYGFINENGDLKVPFQFEDARRFKRGFARVKLGGLWGMINYDGKIVVPALYNDLWAFREERA